MLRKWFENKLIKIVPQQKHSISSNHRFLKSSLDTFSFHLRIFVCPLIVCETRKNGYSFVLRQKNGHSLSYLPTNRAVPVECNNFTENAKIKNRGF